MTLGRGRRSDEENQFNYALGVRICRARKRKHMSALELAKAIGIKPSRLYWYETGRSAIPLYFLSLLGDKLDLPLTTFIPQCSYCGFLKDIVSQISKIC